MRPMKSCQILNLIASMDELLNSLSYSINGIRNLSEHNTLHGNG